MELEDRILDTPITWSLVEEDFQSVLRKTSKIGALRSAEIFGENRGNTSVLVLARFDWTPKDDSLPERAVLKITTCEKLRKVGDSNSQMQFEGEEKRAALMHNAEWNLYEKAKNCPEFREIAKLPTYYCGRSFDFDHLKAGYLTIEHVDNVICFPAYKTVSEKEVEQIVRTFAKLAVFSLKNREIVESMHSDVIDEILKMFISKEKIEAGLDVVVAKFPERHSQIHTLKKLLPFYENYETLREKMKSCYSTRVLCHGDTWLGNILWRVDDHKNLKLQNIIDWQLVHLSSPVEDLIKLLPGSLSSNDYKEKKTFLLQTYFDILKDEIEVDKLPWKSVQELIDEYDQMLPLMGLITFPIALLYEEIIFKNYEGENKQESIDYFRQKVLANFDEAEKCVKKFHL